MKALLICALLIPATLIGQNCAVHDFGFGPGSVLQAQGQEVHPFGGTVNAYYMDNNPNRMLMVRSNSTGDVLWQRLFAATDPGVRLVPYDISCASDGTIIVGGIRYSSDSGSYFNNFAICVDASGATLWARIYARANVDQTTWMKGLVALPGGSALAALKHRELGVSEGMNGWVALDNTGAPGPIVWFTDDGNYNNENPHAFHDLDPAPNGDVVVYGPAANGVAVQRLDAAGNGLWANTYANTWPSFFENALFASNGDILLCGANTMRLDANGNLLWSKMIGSAYYSVIELQTGELLFGGYAGRLLLTDPSGTPISNWQLPTGVNGNPIGCIGDSIFVSAHYDDGQTGGYPFNLAFASVADLGCYGTPTALPLTTNMPVTVVPFTATANSDTLKSWTMSIAPYDPDLLDVAVFASSMPTRPGFHTWVYTNVTNLETMPSGELTVQLTHDTALMYTNSLVPPTSSAPGLLTWTGVAALTGFNGTMNSIQFYLPADTALLGDTLTYTITATQDSTESTLLNNTYSFTRTITASCDPNDKLVFPKDFYHIANDSILDYTIRFQNTGTDTAFNIVVIDTLPPDVDVLTFQAGAASHPYTYSLTGEGLLKFTFSNILLPDSNTNEPLSHGLVNFRIKPIQPIYLGQTISNEADIYFDFNPPVRTPPATVVVTDFMALRPAAPVSELKLYPVPVRDVLTVEVPKNFLPRNAFITASDGHTVWSNGVMNVKERLSIPVQKLATGAYTLTLLSVHGERSQARFVKE